MKQHKIAIMMLVLFLVGGFAKAATSPTTTIDISSFADTTWCASTFINCSTFPFGAQTYNGIPFLIPGNAQGTANNLWYSYVAAGGGNGTVSVTIPINIAKVKTVYTLMNTGWGTTQSGLISVTFSGSDGASWTFN